ncbi:serine hydrolase domain-containing protein [Agromyces sp. H66]|uniref:serine hydrolase domain-containing protein n=1 Tax=Agromyces sp. H66 TaxID=2529859 RepID=UPI0010AA2418|nr:serine hydrolase domain-containing protein [Agromyces sp. H66]
MAPTAHLDPERFTAELDRHLAAVARRRGPLGAPQVAVRSSDGALDYRFGDATQRFHVASIGKLFTATLVMQLVESGAIVVETPITELLPAVELRDLYVIDGVDLADQVTIEHLLTHTSGVADYFEGPVRDGLPFIDLVLGEPDHLWTPAELLDFSRERQRPVGRPGAGFGYSDTGYILLGRIIEEATGRGFHEVLHERILHPLGMIDSALMFRSLPERDYAAALAVGAPTTATTAVATIAPFRLGRQDVSRFTSMSCDWAGGGLISTPGDLLTFNRALHGGQLLSAESLAHLARVRHRFRPGIHYGAGMMEIRLEGFMPLLRGLPRPVGHIGILATHLFHDPVHEVDVVLNFASTREMVRSFRTFIRIEQALARASR